CFLDSVLDVRLRPVPGLELVRVALDVVGDEHVVVVAAAAERELLARLDRIAADDEAPLLLPGLRLPLNPRDFAAGAVTRRPPFARRDLSDPRFHRRQLGCADRVRDLAPLHPGQEGLAPKGTAIAEA